MAEATLPDPARLAQIHAACFTTPRPWSAGEITGLLSLPHNFLLTTGPVGTDTGFLIGSAIAGEAELLTLAVDPAARRQGLGHRLLSDFIATAQTRAATALFLEVAADNLVAISLYQRAGFLESGRRRGYYQRPDGSRTDALLLSRQA